MVLRRGCGQDLSHSVAYFLTEVCSQKKQSLRVLGCINASHKTIISGMAGYFVSNEWWTEDNICLKFLGRTLSIL